MLDPPARLHLSARVFELHQESGTANVPMNDPISQIRTVAKVRSQFARNLAIMLISDSSNSYCIFHSAFVRLYDLCCLPIDALRSGIALRAWADSVSRLKGTNPYIERRFG